MFICNFIVLLDKLFTRLLSIFHFCTPTSDAMHYLDSNSIAKKHVKCTLIPPNIKKLTPWAQFFCKSQASAVDNKLVEYISLSLIQRI